MDETYWFYQFERKRAKQTQLIKDVFFHIIWFSVMFCVWLVMVAFIINYVK